MNRKNFLTLSASAGIGYISKHTLSSFCTVGNFNDSYVMTVKGKVLTGKLGIILPHEHITTDFTGAEKVTQPQYKRDDAFNHILPYLQKVKQSGVSLLVECTPNFIGRDVLLLKQLSEAVGLHIMTNTGYYAAVDLKYLPKHAFDESADQLAARWLKEWTEGIDGTGIRPGFIKLGTGNSPLKDIEHKLIRAAAHTHLQSGLKIAIHTGDGDAAREELQILLQEGVAANALIWVHAQNDKNGDVHLELARKGCWLSLDGINSSDASIKQYTGYLKTLKKENLLHRVLISHDDGWAVNKNAVTGKVSLDLFGNGNTGPYETIFNRLQPLLLQEGFTENDFSTMMIKNPKEAFGIKICKA